MLEIPHDQMARNKMLKEHNDRSRDTYQNDIRCKKLCSEATIPTRSHAHDAGWDLYASENCTIQPSRRQLVKTDIAMAIPEGHVGLIWPRSGLATKSGVDVFAGVVDSGYRGGVGVCLYNSGRVGLVIKKGDRIAQILFQEVPNMTMLEVNELNESNRGSDGFGSSGS